MLRDQPSFDSVWSQAFKHDFIVPATPALDFTRWEVVVLAAGSIADGGRITADSVIDSGPHIIVVVSTEQGCAPIEIVEHPLLFIAIPRARGAPQFLERSRPAPNCRGE
jgi:hypothetical protein